MKSYVIKFETRSANESDKKKKAFEEIGLSYIIKK